MTLSQTDLDALRRCIPLARAESVARRKQIDAKLRDEPWESVARFACFVVQTNSLRLAPWQSAPCNAGLDGLNEPYGSPAALRESSELLRRLLAAGLSKFEPDPLAALAEAERMTSAT